MRLTLFALSLGWLVLFQLLVASFFAFQRNLLQHSFIPGSFCDFSFSQELVATFAFHNYDIIKSAIRKKDPREIQYLSTARQISSVIYAASKGDLTSLTRAALRGRDMNGADYDRRRALHVAAADGHLEICKFLIEKCSVRADPKDRWGNTPLDEARRFNHAEVVEYLERAEREQQGRKLSIITETDIHWEG